MPSEEERATATGNMHKKLGEDWPRSSEDMIGDRQTHTHTDMLITILHSPIEGVIKCVQITFGSSIKWNLYLCTSVWDILKDEHQNSCSWFTGIWESVSISDIASWQHHILPKSGASIFTFLDKCAKWHDWVVKQVQPSQAADNNNNNARNRTVQNI